MLKTEVRGVDRSKYSAQCPEQSGVPITDMCGSHAGPNKNSNGWLIVGSTFLFHHRFQR